MDEQNNDSAGDKKATIEQTREIIKKGLLNLLAMPIYLGILGGIVFLGWRMALRYAMEANPTMRLLLASGIVILILVEIAFSYGVLRFTRWALPRRSADKRSAAKKE